jgi:prolipoprotein diacylglyceryl transferase
MNISYFVWGGDPVMVEFGPFTLPFEFSIIGFLLSLLIIFLGFQYLNQKFNPQPDRRKKTNKRRAQPTEKAKKPSQVPFLYSAGLVAGALLLGQLLLAPLPLPGIEVLGPFQLRWYGLGFASAFLLGYVLGSAMFRHAGYRQDDADALLTYLFVGTLVGARMGEVIFYNPDFYLRNPLEILMIWKGGLASHGAFIGNILAIWLYVRSRPHISYIWVLDRMTIPFAIGGVFVRIGNFFNSEIYGIPTEVPWAVIFQRIDMQPRHPSMLYEAGVGLLLFIVLWSMYKYRPWRHTPPPGALLGTFLTILFTGRFLIEITKVEQADFAVNWIVGMGQLLSIPLVLAGLYILFAKVEWKQYSTSAQESSTEKTSS